MATQFLSLALVACETSAEEIKRLAFGCHVCSVRATANTKYRDYAGEDILEELKDSGFTVQRAEHLEDDGASMVYVDLFVVDKEMNRIEKWLADNDASGISSGALQEFTWGVELGENVEMPDPKGDDAWNHAFSGNVIGYREIYAQVEDGDGDVFDIEANRLTQTT